MGNMGFFEQMIEKKFRNLHCGYIGKVISTDGVTAKVQPLGLMQKTGSSETKAHAVVDDVPVACRFKFVEKKITYIEYVGGPTKTQKIVEPTEIEAGDLVACLCADWNINGARKGQNVLPPAGRHGISDSIIVGILEV